MKFQSPENLWWKMLSNNIFYEFWSLIQFPAQCAGELLFPVLVLNIFQQISSS